MNSAVLSIDIGIHNLGWCIMSTNDDKMLEFGLFDIDENKNADIVVYRTSVVHKFVSSMFIQYDISTVIIERQVNINTMAMELMYCLVSAIYPWTQNIIIFDPKLKFTTLALKYDTKNKNHKRLSINIVRKWLQQYHPNMVDIFEQYHKKDDISDAILMLVIHKYKHDKNMLLAIRSLVV